MRLKLRMTYNVTVSIPCSQICRICRIFCLVDDSHVHALEVDCHLLGLGEVEVHAGSIAANTVHVVRAVSIIWTPRLKIGLCDVGKAWLQLLSGAESPTISWVADTNGFSNELSLAVKILWVMLSQHFKVVKGHSEEFTEPKVFWPAHVVNLRLLRLLSIAWAAAKCLRVGLN